MLNYTEYSYASVVLNYMTGYAMNYRETLDATRSIDH